MKSYIVYGNASQVSKKLKVRFTTDELCDKALTRLGESRKTVKVKVEKMSKKVETENAVDWGDLPSFIINPGHPEITVHFKGDQYIQTFYEEVLEQPYPSKKPRSIWVPDKPLSYPNDAFWTAPNVDTKYPIFVISKGRFDACLTSDFLLKGGVKHFVVVEECEYEKYSYRNNDIVTVLSMPASNNNLGQGSIPVRNWVDEYARQKGHLKHWVLDDNITCFKRFHKNTQRDVLGSVPFRVAEDFSDRYANLYLSGMQYTQFLPEISRGRGCALRNTRIYSCILVHSELKGVLDGVLWRGTYNEDTDLSLRLLKKGFPTVLHQQFTCKKKQTLSCKGGNTTSIYKGDGLKRKVASLVKQHPDVVKETFKFNKPHHQVNYKPFKANKLELKEGLTFPSAPNEYGLRINYQ
jgi:hypothetical protein